MPSDNADDDEVYEGDPFIDYAEPISEPTPTFLRRRWKLILCIVAGLIGVAIAVVVAALPTRACGTRNAYATTERWTTVGEFGPVNVFSIICLLQLLSRSRRPWPRFARSRQSRMFCSRAWRLLSRCCPLVYA